MSFVLALDQGTTSSRAIVFDHARHRPRDRAGRVPAMFPQPGWVEHDAAEIWATQSDVMHEALAKAGIGARDVAAIGITNQRETTVLWDRASGAPDRPRHRLAGPPHGAAVRRAARRGPRRDDRAQDRARARRLLFGHQAQVAARQRSRTLERARRGRARLRHHRLVARLEPDRRRRARDRPSNASRTLLFDIHKGDWDDELLALLDVPRARAAARRSVVGRFAATRSFGGIEVPIAGIAGDQQAALFGQACLAPGLAKNTYGTGCFLLMNTGSERRRVRATSC